MQTAGPWLVFYTSFRVDGTSSPRCLLEAFRWDYDGGALSFLRILLLLRNFGISLPRLVFFHCKPAVLRVQPFSPVLHWTSDSIQVSEPVRLTGARRRGPDPACRANELWGSASVGRLAKQPTEAARLDVATVAHVLGNG